MDIFAFRDKLIDEYSAYVRSFIEIRDSRISELVNNTLGEGMLWPEALIQLNPSFQPGNSIEELIAQNVLHNECSKIFRIGKTESDFGRPLRLHQHQEGAIRMAARGLNYVLTTGTGSGKSLSYIIPIVDSVLRSKNRKGIKAIIVYPMNALANSQYGELEKFLCAGYEGGNPPVTFQKYTGQENEEARSQILANPPDILLTNYVMLELILTRPYESALVQAAQDLRFLVLDELHTYRGRQGADVALLVRRVKEFLNAKQMQCIGTSATLSSHGSFETQKKEIARVASILFGDEVKPEAVIGETLRRTTPSRDVESPEFLNLLKARVIDAQRRPPNLFQEFIEDPLSIWIESKLGVVEDVESKRYKRAIPQSITGPKGLAEALSMATGIGKDRCSEAIKECLLAGYRCERDPVTGFPVFAFRLHQFISRGDTVYGSIESTDDRHLTMQGQQYVPGNRDKVLMPLAFCRECGQEYYVVRKKTDEMQSRFESRELNDQSHFDENDIPGFLFTSSTNPWPTSSQEIMARLPDDWLENGNGDVRIRSDRQKYLPQQLHLLPDGMIGQSGAVFHFIPAPFRFCLQCAVSYGFRGRSDFGKLSSLSSEGRSTATTILSLSAILSLRSETTLEKRARKLLSFTDNRQDASLQAGHFNDFVEISLLRAGLYRAVEAAGGEGIPHATLTQKLFDALALPLDLYASNPAIQSRFQQRIETDKALRQIIGYRIYRDLKRGWRVTSPNLEQCGLLTILYPALDELCAADDVWNAKHLALVSADADTRKRIAKVLLDFMRRELAIKVDYLSQQYQEQLQQSSSQYLAPPWAIDDKEILEHATTLFPRSRKNKDYGGFVYLSPLSGFGQFLRRPSTFPDLGHKLSTGDTVAIIQDLIDALVIGGLVEKVQDPHEEGDVAGYQVPASAMHWLVADGSKGYHDPIRVPNSPEEGARTNSFFVNYYKGVAADTKGLEAREHTAQVDNEDRKARERRFLNGDLPILFCSPTMELGVDIAELNVVNLRNVPPTPANYAQRSGRAGRSGQPALVFSYCSTGSSHDQYFFKRPDRMVAGAVTTPRLDLANEDLIRAHMQALWLTESGLALGKSLKEVLQVEGLEPSLDLQPSVEAALNDVIPKERAKQRALRVLATLGPQLTEADWYTTHWIDEVFAQIALNFDKSCARWRDLYRAALSQAKAQDAIIRDASRHPDDKKQAERLRREAESQLKLLIDVQNVVQSDFYSYRYFASEGFLPGYNFPRLPVSAYISARKGTQKDEFLSRPRFLAISEFGPRSVIYHEGSKYIINKVILPVGTDDVLTQRVKLCEHCGYMHPEKDTIFNNCDRCGRPLGLPMTSMFRMQNVVTKRRERINSDEEERVRLGYEVISGIRFSEVGGIPSVRTASIVSDGVSVGTIHYGHASTIWRINLGWTRRIDREQKGFILDMERGYWARNESDPDDDADPLSHSMSRVIPYVEDRRNALLFKPETPLDDKSMASLQAALKSAIQVEYELEDNELTSEPLPTRANRNLILFYEAAEGGAGVLRRLIDDPEAMKMVAKRALDICHFHPETGEDLHRALQSREDCEAACYDCLMTYSNQSDHYKLDRKAIQPVLMTLSKSVVQSAPSVLSRAEHLSSLMQLAGSDLERDWLQLLEKNNLRLPSRGQVMMEKCQTRPDFNYDDDLVAIYIDGPHHLFPDRHKRDAVQSECMRNSGYTVIRFAHTDDWIRTIKEFPNVFGGVK